MKKKVIFISVILICIIILLSNIFFDKEKYNLYQKNYDKNLFGKEYVNYILDTCSYANNETMCFSSSPLYASNDNYFVYWNIKLMDYLNYNMDSIEDIKNYININIENMDLNNLNYLSEINIYYKIINNDKLFNEIIDNHYDKNSKLFYFEDKNEEDLSVKLSATFIALNTLYNIYMIDNFTELSLIKNKLMELFNNDVYFDINDLDNSLVNYGANIISCLNLLGIKFDDEKKDRKYWLDYWNKNIKKYLKYDLYSLIIINNLYKINLYFNVSSIDFTDYLDDFFANNPNVFTLAKLTSNSSNTYFVNPQIFSIIYEICNNFKYKYPYESETINYLNNNIKTNFAKNTDIVPYVIDNYYGLLLAKKYNYNFDNQKIKKLLDSFYNQYLGEDSNINSAKELCELYYLVASYSILDIKFPDKNLLLNKIMLYITNLKYEDLNTTKTAIIVFKYCFEIYKLCDCKLPLSIKDSLDELLKAVIENNYNIDNNICTSLIDIIIYSKNDKKYKDLYDELLQNLDALKLKGGFCSNLNANNEPDISSTFESFKTILNYRSINKTEKDQLKIFIYSLKKSSYILKGSASGSNADLKCVFEATELSGVYN